MATIFLNKLVEKQLKDVKDTDILVIEDFEDTKKITVANMKTLFSNDEKIMNLHNTLTNYVDVKFDKANEDIEELQNSNREINNMLSSLTDSLGSLALRVTSLERTITELSSKINNMIDIDEKYSERLNQLEIDTESLKDADTDIKNNISQISNTLDGVSYIVNINKESIDKINTDITEIKMEIDTINTNVPSDIKDQISEIISKEEHDYDNIMMVVDHYHHLSHGYASSLAYPIGSIYYTAIEDLDPADYFDSTKWEFLGIVNAIDSEGKSTILYSYRCIGNENTNSEFEGERE